MSQEIKQALAHVLWIGGATDAGKTTISKIIADRYGLQRYHCDHHDLPQVRRLARDNPEYRALLAASQDERWVRPTPEQLFRRALQAFRDRFPLVVEELCALPGDRPVVAEGFGLTPELVAPVLTAWHQAIWLVPTAAFKRASMKRRNKPSFGSQISDPVRATENLIARDMLLAEHVQVQALLHHLALVEVDESLGIDEAAARVEQHFAPILNRHRARAPRRNPLQSND